jgi:hypothetical protein
MEKQVEHLVTRNVQLEKESHDQENKFLELYEEYNIMNDDMHELQQQLEEAGFGDNQSEESFGEDGKTSKSKSLLNIPGKGGKKIMSILKKSRKIIKSTIKNIKSDDASKKEDDTGDGAL